MRKKIISLGLSVLTAGSLAFTATARPASANIVTDLCVVLPSVQAGMDLVFADAGSAAAFRAADLAAKDAALTASTATYISALAIYLQAIADGVPLAGVQADFVAAYNDLVAKFAEWQAADLANFQAAEAFRIASMQKATIDGLWTALCAPPA